MTGMYEEAQLYSPVTTDEHGEVTVHLAHDHPGANDPVYRARRNDIAAGALKWQPAFPGAWSVPAWGCPGKVGRYRAASGGLEFPPPG